MNLMSRFEDNHFDLAIVDPPYGIGLKFSDKVKYRSNGKRIITKGHKQKDWNNQPPSLEYFVELLRVSKKHIVWGCNYYGEAQSLLGQGRIIHNKKPTPLLQIRGASACDIAGTNCQNRITMFDFQWSGNVQGGTMNCKAINDYGKGLEKRIHPTQKPVKLYEWLLMNYAKEGYKILDTHVGSGSIAIACDLLNFDLTGCEIDTEYYNDCMTRLKQHTNQMRLTFK